jgi:hypothetical protein
LAAAGQRDAGQLTVYGLAYLKELHEGRDPRFTGCYNLATASGLRGVSPSQSMTFSRRSIAVEILCPALRQIGQG